MKKLCSLAALVIVGLIYGTGVAAVATPAAAVTASIHASANSAVQPLHVNPLVNTTCPFHTRFFTTYYHGCANWTNWACVALHHFNISPPAFVSNDCLQAVDLFSGQNETGSIICIPGERVSGPLNNPWRSFRITGGGTC